MLPRFANQSVTIIRPGEKEQRGSVVRDWDHATITTVTGCSVQPGGTGLSLDGRVLGISDGWTAYLPDGTDVQAGDRIGYDGMLFEINGEPRRWAGVANTSHVLLNLTRWEG